MSIEKLALTKKGGLREAMKNVKRYHLTLDFHGCNENTLADMDIFYDLLNELPEKIGMKKLTMPYLMKGDYYPGITGFVVIETSHISLHSFTETKQLLIDVFSCQPYDPEKIESELTAIFKPEKVIKNFVKSP